MQAGGFRLRTTLIVGTQVSVVLDGLYGLGNRWCRRQATFHQFGGCACAVQEWQDFSNVLDMLAQCSTEDHGIVKVEEGELSPNAGEGDVHGTLKRSMRVVESRKHSD